MQLFFMKFRAFVVVNNLLKNFIADEKNVL